MVILVWLAGIPVVHAVENPASDDVLPVGQEYDTAAVRGEGLSVVAKETAGSGSQVVSTEQTGATQAPSPNVETHDGIPVGFTREGLPSWAIRTRR